MITLEYYPNSSAFSFLKYILTSSPLRPNILLSTPLSNTIHRSTSFNMTEHVVHQWLQRLINLWLFELKEKLFVTIK